MSSSVRTVLDLDVVGDDADYDDDDDDDDDNDDSDETWTWTTGCSLAFTNYDFLPDAIAGFAKHKKSNS